MPRKRTGAEIGVWWLALLAAGGCGQSTTNCTALTEALCKKQTNTCEWLTSSTENYCRAIASRGDECNVQLDYSISEPFGCPESCNLRTLPSGVQICEARSFWQNFAQIYWGSDGLPFGYLFWNIILGIFIILIVEITPAMTGMLVSRFLNSFVLKSGKNKNTPASIRIRALRFAFNGGKLTFEGLDYTSPNLRLQVVEGGFSILWWLSPESIARSQDQFIDSKFEKDGNGPEQTEFEDQQDDDGPSFTNAFRARKTTKPGRVLGGPKTVPKLPNRMTCFFSGVELSIYNNTEKFTEIEKAMNRFFRPTTHSGGSDSELDVSEDLMKEDKMEDSEYLTKPSLLSRFFRGLKSGIYFALCCRCCSRKRDSGNGKVRVSRNSRRRKKQGKQVTLQHDDSLVDLEGGMSPDVESESEEESDDQSSTNVDDVQEDIHEIPWFYQVFPISKVELSQCCLYISDPSLESTVVMHARKGYGIHYCEPAAEDLHARGLDRYRVSNRIVWNDVRVKIVQNKNFVGEEGLLSFQAPDRHEDIFEHGAKAFFAGFFKDMLQEISLPTDRRKLSPSEDEDLNDSLYDETDGSVVEGDDDGNDRRPKTPSKHTSGENNSNYNPSQRRNSLDFLRPFRKSSAAVYLDRQPSVGVGLESPSQEEENAREFIGDSSAATQGRSRTLKHTRSSHSSVHRGHQDTDASLKPLSSLNQNDFPKTSGSRGIGSQKRSKARPKLRRACLPEPDVLITDKVELFLYYDEPGPVTLEQIESFDSGGQTQKDAPKLVLRIAIGSTEAESKAKAADSLSVTTITYGPWTDNQRGKFFSRFFPMDYQSQPVYAPRKPGEARIPLVFSCCVTFNGEVNFRIPYRVRSIGWYDGSESNSGQNDRSGNLNIWTSVKEHLTAFAKAEEMASSYLKRNKQKSTSHLSFAQSTTEKLHQTFGINTSRPARGSSSSSSFTSKTSSAEDIIHESLLDGWLLDWDMNFVLENTPLASHGTIRAIEQYQRLLTEIARVLHQRAPSVFSNDYDDQDQNPRTLWKKYSGRELQLRTFVSHICQDDKALIYRFERLISELPIAPQFEYLVLQFCAKQLLGDTAIEQIKTEMANSTGNEIGFLKHLEDQFSYDNPLLQELRRVALDPRSRLPESLFTFLHQQQKILQSDPGITSSEYQALLSPSQATPIQNTVDDPTNKSKNDVEGPLSFARQHGLACGWIEVNMSQGSSITYEMPLVSTSENGFRNMFEIKMKQAEVSCSVTESTVLKCAEYSIRGLLEYPNEWNGKQHWTFQNAVKSPELCPIREHVNCFSDLAWDWTENTHVEPNGDPKLEFFIPVEYRFLGEMDKTTWSLLVNEDNVVSSLENDTVNHLVRLEVPKVKFEVNVRFLAFDSPRENVQWSLSLENNKAVDSWSSSCYAYLCLPSNHPRRDIVHPQPLNTDPKVDWSDPRFLTFEHLRMHGTYSYCNKISSQNLDVLNMNMYFVRPKLVALPEAIQALLNFQKNYFGSSTLLISPEDYSSCQNMNLRSRVAYQQWLVSADQKFAKPQANEYELLLKMNFTDAQILLPLYLHPKFDREGEMQDPDANSLLLSTSQISLDMRYNPNRYQDLCLDVSNIRIQIPSVDALGTTSLPPETAGLSGGLKQSSASMTNLVSLEHKSPLGMHRNQMGNRSPLASSPTDHLHHHQHRGRRGSLKTPFIYPRHIRQHPPKEKTQRRHMIGPVYENSISRPQMGQVVWNGLRVHIHSLYGADEQNPLSPLCLYSSSKKIHLNAVRGDIQIAQLHALSESLDSFLFGWSRLFDSDIENGGAGEKLQPSAAAQDFLTSPMPMQLVWERLFASNKRGSGTQYIVRLDLIRAIHLPRASDTKDNVKTHAYAKIICKDQVTRTPLIPDDDSPEWNVTYYFLVPQLDDMDILIYDGAYGRHRLIGTHTLNLSNSPHTLLNLDQCKAIRSMGLAARLKPDGTTKDHLSEVRNLETHPLFQKNAKRFQVETIDASNCHPHFQNSRVQNLKVKRKARQNRKPRFFFRAQYQPGKKESEVEFCVNLFVLPKELKEEVVNDASTICTLGADQRDAIRFRAYTFASLRWNNSLRFLNQKTDLEGGGENERSHPDNGVVSPGAFEDDSQMKRKSETNSSFERIKSRFNRKTNQSDGQINSNGYESDGATSVASQPNPAMQPTRQPVHSNNNNSNLSINPPTFSSGYSLMEICERSAVCLKEEDLALSLSAIYSRRTIVATVQPCELAFWAPSGKSLIHANTSLVRIRGDSLISNHSSWSLRSVGEITLKVRQLVQIQLNDTSKPGKILSFQHGSTSLYVHNVGPARVVPSSDAFNKRPYFQDHSSNQNIEGEEENSSWLQVGYFSLTGTVSHSCGMPDIDIHAKNQIAFLDALNEARQSRIEMFDDVTASHQYPLQWSTLFSKLPKVDYKYAVQLYKFNYNPPSLPQEMVESARESLRVPLPEMVSPLSLEHAEGLESTPPASQSQTSRLEKTRSRTQPSASLQAKANGKIVKNRRPKNVPNHSHSDSDGSFWSADDGSDVEQGYASEASSGSSSRSSSSRSNSSSSSSESSNSQRSDSESENQFDSSSTEERSSQSSSNSGRSYGSKESDESANVRILGQGSRRISSTTSYSSSESDYSTDSSSDGSMTDDLPQRANSGIDHESGIFVGAHVESFSAHEVLDHHIEVANLYPFLESFRLESVPFSTSECPTVQAQVRNQPLHFANMVRQGMPVNVFGDSSVIHTNIFADGPGLCTIPSESSEWGSCDHATREEDDRFHREGTDTSCKLDSVTFRAHASKPIDILVTPQGLKELELVFLGYHPSAPNFDQLMNYFEKLYLRLPVSSQLQTEVKSAQVANTESQAKLRIVGINLRMLHVGIPSMLRESVQSEMTARPPSPLLKRRAEKRRQFKMYQVRPVPHLLHATWESLNVFLMNSKEKTEIGFRSGTLATRLGIVNAFQKRDLEILVQSDSQRRVVDRICEVALFTVEKVLMEGILYGSEDSRFGLEKSSSGFELSDRLHISFDKMKLDAGVDSVRPMFNTFHAWATSIQSLLEIRTGIFFRTQHQWALLAGSVLKLSWRLDNITEINIEPKKIQSLAELCPPTEWFNYDSGDLPKSVVVTRFRRIACFIPEYDQLLQDIATCHLDRHADVNTIPLEILAGVGSIMSAYTEKGGQIRFPSSFAFFMDILNSPTFDSSIAARSSSFTKRPKNIDLQIKANEICARVLVPDNSALGDGFASPNPFFNEEDRSMNRIWATVEVHPADNLCMSAQVTEVSLSLFKKVSEYAKGKSRRLNNSGGIGVRDLDFTGSVSGSVSSASMPRPTTYSIDHNICVKVEGIATSVSPDCVNAINASKSVIDHASILLNEYHFKRRSAAHLHETEISTIRCNEDTGDAGLNPFNHQLPSEGHTDDEPTNINSQVIARNHRSRYKKQPSALNMDTPFEQARFSIHSGMTRGEDVIRDMQAPAFDVAGFSVPAPHSIQRAGSFFPIFDHDSIESPENVGDGTTSIPIVDGPGRGHSSSVSEDFSSKMLKTRKQKMVDAKRRKSVLNQHSLDEIPGSTERNAQQRPVIGMSSWSENTFLDELGSIQNEKQDGAVGQAFVPSRMYGSVQLHETVQDDFPQKTTLGNYSPRYFASNHATPPIEVPVRFSKEQSSYSLQSENTGNTDYDNPETMQDQHSIFVSIIVDQLEAVLRSSSASAADQMKPNDYKETLAVFALKNQNFSWSRLSNCLEADLSSRLDRSPLSGNSKDQSEATAPQSTLRDFVDFTVEGATFKVVGSQSETERSGWESTVSVSGLYVNGLFAVDPKSVTAGRSTLSSGALTEVRVLVGMQGTMVSIPLYVMDQQKVQTLLDAWAEAYKDSLHRWGDFSTHGRRRSSTYNFPGAMSPRTGFDHGNGGADWADEPWSAQEFVANGGGHGQDPEQTNSTSPIRLGKRRLSLHERFENLANAAATMHQDPGIVKVRYSITCRLNDSRIRIEPNPTLVVKYGMETISYAFSKESDSTLNSQLSVGKSSIGFDKRKSPASQSVRTVDQIFNSQGGRNALKPSSPEEGINFEQTLPQIWLRASLKASRKHAPISRRREESETSGFANEGRGRHKKSNSLESLSLVSESDSRPDVLLAHSSFPIAFSTMSSNMSVVSEPGRGHGLHSTSPQHRADSDTELVMRLKVIVEPIRNSFTPDIVEQFLVLQSGLASEINSILASMNRLSAELAGRQPQSPSSQSLNEGQHHSGEGFTLPTKRGDVESKLHQKKPKNLSVEVPPVQSNGVAFNDSFVPVRHRMRYSLNFILGGISLAAMSDLESIDSPNFTEFGRSWEKGSSTELNRKGPWAELHTGRFQLIVKSVFANDFDLLNPEKKGKFSAGGKTEGEFDQMNVERFISESQEMVWFGRVKFQGLQCSLHRINSAEKRAGVNEHAHTVDDLFSVRTDIRVLYDPISSKQQPSSEQAMTTIARSAWNQTCTIRIENTLFSVEPGFVDAGKSLYTEYVNALSLYRYMRANERSLFPRARGQSGDAGHGENKASNGDGEEIGQFERMDRYVQLMWKNVKEPIRSELQGTKLYLKALKRMAVNVTISNTALLVPFDFTTLQKGIANKEGRSFLVTLDSVKGRGYVDNLVTALFDEVHGGESVESLHRRLHSSTGSIFRSNISVSSSGTSRLNTDSNGLMRKKESSFIGYVTMDNLLASFQPAKQIKKPINSTLHPKTRSAFTLNQVSISISGQTGSASYAKEALRVPNGVIAVASPPPPRKVESEILEAMSEDENHTGESQSDSLLRTFIVCTVSSPTLNIDVPALPLIVGLKESYSIGCNDTKLTDHLPEVGELSSENMSLELADEDDFVRGSEVRKTALRTSALRPIEIHVTTRITPGSINIFGKEEGQNAASLGIGLDSKLSPDGVGRLTTLNLPRISFTSVLTRSDEIIWPDGNTVDHSYQGQPQRRRTSSDNILPKEMTTKGDSHRRKFRRRNTGDASESRKHHSKSVESTSSTGRRTETVNQNLASRPRFSSDSLPQSHRETVQQDYSNQGKMPMPYFITKLDVNGSAEVELGSIQLSPITLVCIEQLAAEFQRIQNSALMNDEEVRDPAESIVSSGYDMESEPGAHSIDHLNESGEGNSQSIIRWNLLLRLCPVDIVASIEALNPGDDVSAVLSVKKPVEVIWSSGPVKMNAEEEEEFNLECITAYVPQIDAYLHEQSYFGKITFLDIRGHVNKGHGLMALPVHISMFDVGRIECDLNFFNSEKLFGLQYGWIREWAKAKELVESLTGFELLRCSESRESVFSEQNKEGRPLQGMEKSTVDDRRFDEDGTTLNALAEDDEFTLLEEEFAHSQNISTMMVEARIGFIEVKADLGMHLPMMVSLEIMGISSRYFQPQILATSDAVADVVHFFLDTKAVLLQSRGPLEGGVHIDPGIALHLMRDLSGMPSFDSLMDRPSYVCATELRRFHESSPPPAADWQPWMRNKRALNHCRFKIKDKLWSQILDSPTTNDPVQQRNLLLALDSQGFLLALSEDIPDSRTCTSIVILSAAFFDMHLSSEAMPSLIRLYKKLEESFEEAQFDAKLKFAGKDFDGSSASGSFIQVTPAGDRDMRFSTESSVALDKGDEKAAAMDQVRASTLRALKASGIVQIDIESLDISLVRDVSNDRKKSPAVAISLDETCSLYLSVGKHGNEIIRKLEVNLKSSFMVSRYEQMFVPGNQFANYLQAHSRFGQHQYNQTLLPNAKSLHSQKSKSRHSESAQSLELGKLDESGAEALPETKKEYPPSAPHSRHWKGRKRQKPVFAVNKAAIAMRTVQKLNPPDRLHSRLEQVIPKYELIPRLQYIFESDFYDNPIVISTDIRDYTYIKKIVDGCLKSVMESLQPNLMFEFRTGDSPQSEFSETMSSNARRADRRRSDLAQSRHSGARKDGAEEQQHQKLDSETQRLFLQDPNVRDSFVFNPQVNVMGDATTIALGIVMNRLDLNREKLPEKLHVLLTDNLEAILAMAHDALRSMDRVFGDKPAHKGGKRS